MEAESEQKAGSVTSVRVEGVVRRRLPDETSFPDNTDDLEWRLRYAPETITRGDQLNLASICSAYRYLTKEATLERVKYVCGHIRRA